MSKIRNIKFRKYIFIILVNRFGGSGLSLITDAISKSALTTLKELDISCNIIILIVNRINDGGIKKLSSTCINHCSNLKSIILDGNTINHAGVEYMASGMSKGAFKGLEKLSLKCICIIYLGNDIGSKALESISHHIRISSILKNLKEIDFERCNLTHKSVNLFMGAITKGGCEFLSKLIFDCINNKYK